MAKFLTTTGISHLLEELIKGTKDRLILISPYLQLHNKIKNNIENLNIQKKDIRIIYRESKLHIDENNWLDKQIGVRTSICPTLHAKCYLNESEAIVTSMNLYSFSQQNNDEMGIHVTKENDPELYAEIFEEATRLLTISKEIRVSVKTIEKEIEMTMPFPVIEPSKKKDYANSKLLTTKEIAHITGISSRKVNTWLTDSKLMYKKDDDWFATKKGYELGAQQKEGSYGKFIIWPEEIIKDIT